MKASTTPDPAFQPGDPVIFAIDERRTVIRKVEWCDIGERWFYRAEGMAFKWPCEYFHPDVKKP